jgi:aspartyl-tRNA(Asn)/glutamyl-tRNA(Gln) amidotransferase subunit B
MRAIHMLVRWLDICDGNMQEGSFRCDANVSVRPRGSDQLGTRTELKNLNSFRFVEQAIEYEAARQIEVLESGGSIVQETRLYNPDRGETRSMRSKEEAHDYRYFPDPDLLPLILEPAFIEEVRRELPELPEARRERFMRDYHLSDYDSSYLTGSRELADYFEATVRAAGGEAKLCANWIMGNLAAALNRENKNISDSVISPTQLGNLIQRIADQTVSATAATTVFTAMWRGEGDADAIIAQRGLRQVTDAGAIEKLVDEVIAENPQQVEQYRAGKQKVIGFLVGQVMKKSQGKANPQQVNELLVRRLQSG